MKHKIQIIDNHNRIVKTILTDNRWRVWFIKRNYREPKYSTYITDIGTDWQDSHCSDEHDRIHSEKIIAIKAEKRRLGLGL